MPLPRKRPLPILIAALLLPPLSPLPGRQESNALRTLSLRKGDHVCLIGNSLADRMALSGDFETLLHSRFPEKQLVIRNLAWPADLVTSRSRPEGHESLDSQLHRYRADVIIACFGFNEAFAGATGAGAFERDVDAFVRHLRSQKFNGRSAPRVVLVSPIAFENLGDPFFPGGIDENLNLIEYTQAIARVAEKHQLTFADIYLPTHELMHPEVPKKTPLTSNGVHLTDEGYALLAPILEEQIFGDRAASALAESEIRTLRDEVREKCRLVRLRERPANSAAVSGRSGGTFGEAHFPAEFALLDRMIVDRDHRIWALADGESVSLEIEGSEAGALPAIQTNWEDEVAFLAPEEQQQTFSLPQDFAINCFASETGFPDLRNPVQMTFDNRGRLWVLTMPSYPQYLPGVPPDDKLLIFEDTDGDGAADKQTIFAQDLYLASGFAIAAEGVFVAQPPDISLLRDLDGDDISDRRETVLQGFGAEDSSRAIRSFTLGPDGGIYFAEGRGIHSRVETPRGIVGNAVGGCVWRYVPRTRELGCFITDAVEMPTGQAFDRWGQSFFTDAMDGAGYWTAPLTGRVFWRDSSEDPAPGSSLAEDLRKHPRVKPFAPCLVRPTTASLFVSSRNFPDDWQGHWLVANALGFRGIKRLAIADDGAGFAASFAADLVSSADPNFVPTDMRFGPDGALYIADWHSPLVEHWDHSLRDPNRDRSHGRIWRLASTSRPLLETPSVAGASVKDLIELLKSPEDGARARARLELCRRPDQEVAAALKKWTAGLDAADPGSEHHLLEALWVLQSRGTVSQPLLERLLRAGDFRVRAAATRVLRFQLPGLPDALALLAARAADDSPRVRAEAALAAGFAGSLDGVHIALELTRRPMDDWLRSILKETLQALEKHWKPALLASENIVAPENHAALRALIEALEPDERHQLPDSLPLFEAILSTGGNASADLQRALDFVALANDIHPVAHLLGAIASADSTDADNLADLLGLLRLQDSAQVRGHESALFDLARSARLRATRRAAAGVLWRTAEDPQPLFNLAEGEPGLLTDLLFSIPSSQEESVPPALAEAVLRWLESAAAASAQPSRYPPVRARFVRVSVPQPSAVLSITEVEVFSSGKNVAIDGTASQSSSRETGAADRAIDGEREYREHRNKHRNSYTLTCKGGPSPWWEVDLGREFAIDSIAIWGTGSNGLGTPEAQFALAVFDENRHPVYVVEDNPPPHTVRRFELGIDPSLYLRNPAIAILPRIMDTGALPFGQLIAFIDQPPHRLASLHALAGIPTAKWPVPQRRVIFLRVAELLETTPGEERYEPEYRAALDLARMGVEVLSEPRDSTLRSRLEGLVNDW